MKRYRLLKELPTFHADDIFTLGEDGCLYLTEPCDFIRHCKSRVMAYHKNTLASFPNILEDWFEEIEEPKEYWYIRGDDSSIGFSPIGNCEVAKRRKQIGNYFETKEEAEKAVERLRAWKRLKDAGYRFREWYEKYENGEPDYGVALIELSKPDGYSCDLYETYKKELDLLFGGEE